MSTVHKVMQLWRPGQYIKPHDAGPRIGHLFGAGQQGGVYLFDKAHQASAFQGGAYDTPLSAVEQFIGSFYDLSGNANHCAQTTSTARGKWSARVNLLTKTEDFSDAVWNKGNCYVASVDSKIAPDGKLSADYFAANSIDAQHALQYSLNSITAGIQYKAAIYVHPDTAPHCYLRFLAGPAFPTLCLVSFNLLTGAVIGETNAVGSIKTLAGGWFEVTITATASASGSTNLATALRSSIFDNNVGDGNGMWSWGSSLTLASNAHLPYQWVNTAADYDTAGFPHYLLPDGADDYYTSASGGGSTTGIFICTAIAPMAAGAKQVIWSDASGNTGYELCINASNQVEFSAGTGSARVSCVSAALSFGAPKVITAQHDGTTLTVRVDGVATTAACGAASAGTAGTTLLRANGAASSYAKVQINGLVQRHGAQPSAEQLTFAERYMANLQGRTL